MYARVCNVPVKFTSVCKCVHCNIQMPHYWGKYFAQIGSKSPSKPGRGVVGLNIDRRITATQLYTYLQMRWKVAAQLRELLHTVKGHLHI